MLDSKYTHPYWHIYKSIPSDVCEAFRTMEYPRESSCNSTGATGPFLVLTRLAEKIPGRAHNLVSFDWIENQCQFLEKYALPSLKAQTDQSFLWIVSVSDSLAPALLERVRTAVGPRGVVIFQKGNEHSSETFARFLSQYSADYVTVRFDSDDVLHPTFVCRAKQHIVSEMSVYSFISGVVYDLDLKIAGSWPHASNTFLFHRGAGGENVYSLGVHSRVQSTFGPVMRIISTESPMWMKLTHKHNGWGDSITDADRPLFGNFVQRHFTSGDFPTRFLPQRDLARLVGFTFSRLFKLRLREKKTAPNP